MIDPIEITLIVKDFSIINNRLDAWITEAIKASIDPKQDLNRNNLLLSRSRVKKLIESNQIEVNGLIVSDPSLKVKSENIIKINLPVAIEAIPSPQNIDLDILPIKQDGTEIKLTRPIHPHLPQIQNGQVGILISPVKTGKSTIISNLLLNPNFYKDQFDMVYIISNTINNDRTSNKTGR